MRKTYTAEFELASLDPSPTKFVRTLEALSPLFTDEAPHRAPVVPVPFLARDDTFVAVEVDLESSAGSCTECAPKKPCELFGVHHSWGSNGRSNQMKRPQTR